MRVGIDIGGTFTDFVLYDEHTGRIERKKILSTPSEPEQAVLVELLSLQDLPSLEVVHGSTVATNALLERTGAATAFITTHGFKDILAIGRQNRESLYDLFADRPSALIPPDLCFEVKERVNHAGEIIRELLHSEVERLLHSIANAEVESISLCLLFSFLDPTHEQLLTRELRAAGYHVSPSHEILPEFREYERASTTTINAYVAPVMESYLSKLELSNASSSLRIMQSNGGSIKVRQALEAPVRTILSGPAGGVVGATHIAQQAGYSQIISMDMGGTSTDVSLSSGSVPLTNETVMDGIPIRVPMIDIHSIGAGGGSIAEIDPGGALRVGPRSAGAQPGPACYGQGGQVPTVTDANLVLGRLVPEFFHAGRMHLDQEAATRVIASLTDYADYSSHPTLSTIQQAALGVIQVVNANMLRALRVISVERGYDPRDFTLVSFGGAGGLHACELAKELGITHVLIPEAASTLSAFGMLTADVVKDYVLTIMVDMNTDYETIEKLFNPLVGKATRDLAEEGFARDDIEFKRELEVRYQGQSYELTIPFSPDIQSTFHTLHKDVYGYQFSEREVEIVNLRLRATGEIVPPPPGTEHESSTHKQHLNLESREVVLIDSDTGLARVKEVPAIQRQGLIIGEKLEGSAILLQPDTTVFLPEKVRCHVDRSKNLLIEVDV